MFEAIRNWRRRRMLLTAAIPEPLWRQALDALPFLAIYTEDELSRLRERVVVFLSEKSIVGAARFVVTPLMRVLIAMQACAPALYLDADCYDGWENVVVYPDEFIIAREFEDEAGVVHRHREQLAGDGREQAPECEAGARNDRGDQVAFRQTDEHADQVLPADADDRLDQADARADSEESCRRSRDNDHHEQRQPRAIQINIERRIVLGVEDRTDPNP